MNARGFGRYREIAVLGQGGMARVVLAALPGPAGTQKLLVVKEMLPELAQDAEFVGMFTDEARLACRLDHPNLIQTYELAEVDGRYFFVMEYLEGQSLGALLTRTRRRVPLPIYLRVLTRVLAGLHYAHELSDLDGRPLGVVHRDVTPQNIFVCYGGAIKLVDFGIAKAAGAAILTKAGTFKGKIAYSSKEQLGNEPVDRRADVFAAGILLWEAIVGHRITKGLAEPAILQRRFFGEDPDALSVNPLAPPELAAIAKKAMSTERENRYATAREMQAALESYIETSGMRVVDEDVGRHVASIFAEERLQVRKLVQERLSKPDSEDPLLEPVALSSQTSLSDPSSGSESKPAARAPAAAGEPPTQVTVSLETPVRRARSRVRVIAGAAVVVLSLGVIGGWSMLRRRVVIDRPASASSTAAAISPPAAAGSAFPEARLVDVSLIASPATARFSLDGRALEGNPYKGRLPSDGTSHKLEAAAAGFVTETRALTLDGAVQVELSLKPEQASITSAVRPGQPARPPTRAAKPIDTSDPYGPQEAR